MIIRRMCATFGKLDQQELRLRPGLNIISGDNEAGKSTWLAFLLVMLYGIDTKDRGQPDRLPDKLKYQPWSGKPMAGTMELEDEGRCITLERTSQTAPLGDFRAWDTKTGSPLTELTGKTCGQTLLGVEAGVYARSGYLRQHRLSVSADAQLEKRLSSLVTVGNEDYSYAELDEKLKKLQTALRHNQSGALPRAEEARQETLARLKEIGESQQKVAELEAALEDLRAQRRECQEILAGLAALEQKEQSARLDAAQEALGKAVEDRQGWEAVCAELPPEETLQELEAALRQLQNDLEKAAVEEGLHVEELDLPEEDPVFGRMSVREAHDQAAADAALVHNAKAAKRPKPTPFLPLFALMLLGLGVGYYGASLPLLWPVIAGISLALMGLGLWFSLRNRYRAKCDAYVELQRSARCILEKYEVNGPKGVLQRGMDYIRSIEQRESLDGGVSREILAGLADRRDQLLRRLDQLMPGCDSVEKAEILFQEAANAREALLQAQLVEQQRSVQLRELDLALEPVTEAAADAARFAGYDRETETKRLKDLEVTIEATAARSAMLSGAIGQMGTVEDLQARLEALEADIRRMETRYAAICLARRALMSADEALRAKFAPLLCEKTSAIFQKLTAGRYDQIQLDRNLHVTVHPKDSPVFRSLSYLSDGTVDQLYLALRLAICEMLVPKAPLILDDALAYFDDKRAALALDTLWELGKERQVLIFTCQNRERRILDELSKKRRKKHR